MKTLLSLLTAGFFLLIPASAHAVKWHTVTLAWDANPPDQFVTHYTLYEYSYKVGIWKQIAKVTTNQYVLAGVTNGEHTWAVTASNVIGESERSDPLTADFPPKPPRSLRAVTMTIHL